MTTRRQLLSAAATLPILAMPAPGHSQAVAPPVAPPVASPAAPLVVRQDFSFTDYSTRGGARVPVVRIGYQTAGRLNAAGDNAVLITHFFSGNGHAFGRLRPEGPVGWWDSIIGPGKPIDTDRFYVVASDTLVNLNAPDQHTVTTGPASVNPSTGRPWGMNFPVVSIRDFVEVQKRLLESLGVRRLALVAGPSMGALQAVEWAAAYPSMVERVMPAIGTGEVDAWMMGWLDLWCAPIRLDSNWRNGDYYGQGREAPLRGLAEALRIVTLHSRDRGWAAQFGRRPAEGQEPARRIQDRFAVEQWLDSAAAARARLSDANSFLYLARANQLFLNEYESPAAALSGAPRRWLVLPSQGDRVFPVEYSRELEAVLRQAGKQVELQALSGGLGHLEGVGNIAQAEAAIRRFLAP
ncbi:E22 family MetX-like putative esterase [Teichococcus oryzae]|uniref:Probable acyltransferase n=1 Tax=Teichococcus oryzae TaxID=1608942 RepID=A0A5B2TLS0_9PROT|nr:homoserine O-acetyltransferase [Pseudoroseomonas oryzae]KAA2214710.1 homoserine O-acetyltransferase [Pseudoroseomonas oryzae]